MTRASIDLGSNSVLLTVLDVGDRVLHDECRVVGLGKGLGDGGAFAADRMAAARAALADYVATARDLGVPADRIRAVATSAARRATNAPSFFAALRAELGLAVRTISGDEEALLAYLGARWDLSELADPLLVIDVGGGSTEVVLGRGEVLLCRRSLEAGSARLTEAFLGVGRVAVGAVGRARAHVAALVATLELPASPAQAVAVAGTATTLAAIDAGLETYDGDVVHGRVLSRRALQALGARLAEATPAERLHLARVSPQRAHFLLAGCLLIDGVLARAGLDRCTISDRGLRYGVLAAIGSSMRPS